ncbi:TetR/AcrR family transcriptional regulator [Novosphingobium sp. PP1Y]|uniref:TetR/AcrR family transcriptional regulator n=1 Tax=Novosphingobium sp. PP1Y TaxID=702113 RepID=UPI00031B831F|nr:TetR/AcrR family transcriptional regulator [Novosphingobium sp. PP1Y]
MPRKAKARDAGATLSVDTVSKTPLQGRSKASLERMLVAAEKLMLARGSEDFTLQDVSQSGNVSIGSIYLRFESKENLVRAVIGNHLAKMALDEDAMIEKVRAGATSLTTFVPRFVEGFAELLKKHAPLLRLSMQRASFDPLVSEPGRASANRAAAICIEAMLEYRGSSAATTARRRPTPPTRSSSPRSQGNSASDPQAKPCTSRTGTSSKPNSATCASLTSLPNCNLLQAA